MSDALGPEGSYYEAKRREAEMERKRKSNGSYPVMMVILYLILGVFLHLWHPGWLLFLTVPLHYIPFDSMRARFLHPVSLTLAYLVLGFFFDLWHPGWLIFLLVPLGAVRGWF